jgi:sigma-B regulation protein RsbU (phosphoserine phosphatase)
MELLYQEQRLKELFLLKSATRKINSILDLDRLLEEIVGDTLQTFGYCRSAILLIDEKTNELEIAAVRGWTTNFHLKGERFKIGKYGITGHVAETGKTYYAPDVTIDPYYEVSEESTRSEVDIPLKAHGKLIGVFNIQDQKVNAFNKERIQVLETLAGDISIAIENARLFQKERLEKERMLNELYEARKIQLNLFPKSSPVIRDFKISAAGLPCQEVGGDWYDFIPLKDGRLGIVLADVSGKGMGAALLMSSTRSILRLLANLTGSPGKVLEQVNEILLNDFPISKFVTMIYAVLDPQNRTLVFANAGHLYPLYINSEYSNYLKTTDGIPLGITNGTFSECKVEFSRENRLILYTDGVTEAINNSFEEFGTERLKTHFTDPSSSIKTIIDEVKNFSQFNSFSDDFTIIMIETAF